MALDGIAMRPMDDAAFLIPLIFALKFHYVTRGDVLQAGGKIDVVRDQDREA